MDKEKRVADKRAARNHKEDVILNRVLIWFGAAVVVELILLLLNRYYINITTAPGEIEFAGTLLKAWPAIIGVTAAGTVICLLWTVFWAKGGKRVTLPGVLFGIFFTGLVISAVTYRFYDTGVQFLCGVVPAAAVLALVYYLYQHEFFAVTVLSALGLEDMALVSYGNSGTIASFNFAQVQDGALRLGSGVKVSVALDDGSIYSYNGEDYSYEEAELNWNTDQETAAGQLPENVSSQGQRRVTIESEGGRELPCYEFNCINSQGESLTIYVNAETGKQCRIDI